MSLKSRLLDIDEAAMTSPTDAGSQRIVELAARSLRITVEQIEWLLSDAVTLGTSNEILTENLEKYQNE